LPGGIKVQAGYCDCSRFVPNGVDTRLTGFHPAHPAVGGRIALQIRKSGSVSVFDKGLSDSNYLFCIAIV
jgi:hypothetical protein